MKWKRSAVFCNLFSFFYVTKQKCWPSTNMPLNCLLMKGFYVDEIVNFIQFRWRNISKCMILTSDTYIHICEYYESVMLDFNSHEIHRRSKRCFQNAQNFIHLNMKCYWWVVKVSMFSRTFLLSFKFCISQEVMWFFFLGKFIDFDQNISNFHGKLNIIHTFEQ